MHKYHLMKARIFFLIAIIGISLLVLSNLIVSQKYGSCSSGGTTYCDKIQSPDGCYCDTKKFGDYCSDIDK